MGFGTLGSSTEDARRQLFNPNRKLSLPEKRPLDLDEGSCDEGVPQKMAKLALSPGEADTACGSSPSSSSDSVMPAERVAVVPDLSKVCIDESLASPTKDGLDKAVEAAVHTFREEWVAWACDRVVAKGKDIDKREDAASEVAEARILRRYDDMKAALLNLLPWMGAMQPDEQGGNYQVVEFQGQQPPRRIRNLDEDELLPKELEWLRGASTKGRAWEACCAVMASVSTRKEKCWMEANDIAEDVEDELEELPKKRSEKDKLAQREGVIRKIIDEEIHAGWGFFAHYLVTPTTNLRIAFAPGPSLTPASLVITARLPLWDALVSLDDDFPFKAEAKSREWCLQAGRQFALQDSIFGVEEKAKDSRKTRVVADSLKPDPKLRDLLRSKKPVVQLEILAALAPREVMKRQGLSEIVKAECAKVMREAKSRGEAVVFCLGSGAPHLLAEKVYMRKPIGDYGLRCGYLRWRASENVPWARESQWDDRTCLCIQMP